MAPRNPKTPPLSTHASRWMPASAVALLLTASCSPSNPPREPSTEATGARPLEAVDGDPLELEPIHVRVGQVAREPMLVLHPDGSWWLTGYGAQDPESSSPRHSPNLWRSDDRGTSWSSVDVGDYSDGAYGNSDVDLTIGPEGNLYFIAMGFDRTTFRGTHVTVGTSHDVGETWNWSVLSETELDDRPWVRATPDGVVHAIWNDGEGVAYARSTDAGRTWVEQPRIHDAGGSSHLAVGPNGEIAVRIGPMSASGNRNHPGEDWIAVSTDGGETWNLRPPPGNGRWPSSIAELGTHPRWVDPLAWGASGDLIHAWTSDDGLQLARSANRGETWTTWRIAPSPTDGALFFPYLTGGFDVAHSPNSGDINDSSDFALTWFERSGADLWARVARVTVGSSAVSVERSEPLALPIHRRSVVDGEENLAPDTGGEYFPAVVSQSGNIVAATTIQADPGGDGFTVWVEKE